MIKADDENLLERSKNSIIEIKSKLPKIFVGEVYFVIRSNVWRAYAFWLDGDIIDEYLNKIITIVGKWINQWYPVGFCKYISDGIISIRDSVSIVSLSKNKNQNFRIGIFEIITDY